MSHTREGININFHNAKFVASYGLMGQLPVSEISEVAICGRSNVGKSSLINKLLQRKSLARVSCVPGKTATLNFYSLENLNIVDLPGYGYAKVAKTEKQRFSALIDGYLSSDRAIELVILLVDMRHKPSKDDLTMINFLIDEEMPFIIVFTKADKLSNTQREARMMGFKQEIPCFDDIVSIVTSAEKGEGIDDIRQILNDISESE